MYVIKRDGRSEAVYFDKITTRISNLMEDLDPTHVEPVEVAQRVVSGIYPGVPTTELDQLAAETAASFTTRHPDYAVLAARIAVSNLHKMTHAKFSDAIRALHTYVNPETGKPAPLISEKTFNHVMANRDAYDKYIVDARDFTFNYFGFKTLERSYLLRMHNLPAERPQYLFMRVAIGIHGPDIDAALETYDHMSKGFFTHASPTLFNAGTPTPQLSSCFLLTMKDDSIDGIYDTLKTCAMISKTAGGIGLSVHNIRATGSYIAGTNGHSNGLVPMLRVFNNTARYVDQGGNKRPGAFACFATDTEVMTTNAGVKAIQDVQVGDLVVTHMNRVRPVVQVHKNPIGDRKLYKLKVSKSKEVVVTGNHEFWSGWTKKYKDKMVSTGWHSVESLKALMDAPETTRQTCYISIPSGAGLPESPIHEQLDLKDYSAYILDGIDGLEDAPGGKVVPVTNYTDHHGNLRSNRGQMINRFWTINEDLVNLFGMWLGDGCIRKFHGKVNGIMFTVHRDNTPEIDFIQKTCRAVFGCTVKTVVSRSDKKVTCVYVNSHVVGMVFMALFGSHFDGKRLPEMVFGWPLKLVNHFMAGIITTDGHIAKRGYATLSLSNPFLMNQLYHLCRNHGLNVSAPKKGSMSEGMTCHSYTMSIPLSRDILENTYKLYDDGRVEACLANVAIKEQTNDNKFLKVLDIVEVDRADKWVYTLGVEEDHSYTVEGGLVAKNCYLEPWHADIFEFLELKKNTGAEEQRARDLFFGLWIPDLFMKRVETKSTWTLMCPRECPGLEDSHGDEFESLYLAYEAQGKGRRTVDATKLWFAILDAQTETGTPYMLYKDACNAKSNQKNLGTIRSSNLCTEIIEYSAPDEIAVCNLASLALNKFVEDGEFNYKQLHQVTKIVTRNLNRIIDINYYPVPETRKSNFRHRPIGIGVQGLADAFVLMRIPFDSERAREVNRDIFETIYHAALEASAELALKHGAYETFGGSPASRGTLQFDMWGVKPSPRWDWAPLRKRICDTGIRNSLLVAPMPTASTAQILGNNESIEPFTSNIYTRRVLSGEFQVVNKHLLRDLVRLKLWSEDIKEQIILNAGSIQHIDVIPDHIKQLYKTVWELSQRTLIDMAADRGAFIDQSQSFNVHIADPTFAKLTSMHFYAWKKGLKTGMYYLRSRAATNAIQFTVDAQKAKDARDRPSPSCSSTNSDECLVCSA